MRILNSFVVYQDSMLQTGCAPASSAALFLYLTARMRQDISASTNVREGILLGRGGNNFP